MHERAACARTTPARDSAPRQRNRLGTHSLLLAPPGPGVHRFHADPHAEPGSATPAPPRRHHSRAQPGADGLAEAPLTGGRRLRHRNATLPQHRRRLEVPAAAGAEAGAGGAAGADREGERGCGTLLGPRAPRQVRRRPLRWTRRHAGRLSISPERQDSP